VDAIRERFRGLNPYDPTLVPDILKVEATGICDTISAKRYVICDQLPGGGRRILKRSQHGLGRYLDPISPDRERRDTDGNLVWVDEAWHWILDVHDNPNAPLPQWATLPALSRITVSSPTLWAPFTAYNHGKPWAEQIKPFNFLLVADVDPFGYPPGVDPTRFRLIAAYTDTPQRWTQLQWRNLYDPDGPAYRITTDRDAPVEPDLVIVKSYAQVLREYRLHPEHKFNGPDGKPCGRNTTGILHRRPVHVLDLRHIGKEANRLDDVQAGLIGDLNDVLTEYHDPDGGLFHRLVLPVLDRYSGRQLGQLVASDRRTIDRIRSGQKPRLGLRNALTALAVNIAEAELASTHHQQSRRDAAGLRRHQSLAILAAWHDQFRAA
jgi:hypothetical protein